MWSLKLTPAALEDLRYWIKHDPRKALRTIELIIACSRDPFDGPGKPEPLKHEFAGCWSRRIDREHRLVYRVRGDVIRIMQCRHHYS